MDKRTWRFLLLSAFVSLGVCFSCTTSPSMTPTTTITPEVLSASTPTIAPREMISYTNTEHHFSLSYPANWIIIRENYREIILVPQEQQDWQPTRIPEDLFREPEVKINLGNDIREMLGPKNFPQRIDPTILQGWLEQNMQNDTEQSFVKRPVGNSEVFELTEISEGGCDRIVYWRPESLEQLVRLSTGCESPYLSDFGLIVNSLQSIE